MWPEQEINLSLSRLHVYQHLIAFCGCSHLFSPIMQTFYCLNQSRPNTKLQIAIHDHFVQDCEDLPFFRCSQLTVLFNIFSAFWRVDPLENNLMKKTIYTLPCLHFMEWLDSSQLCILPCSLMRSHFIKIMKSKITLRNRTNFSENGFLEFVYLVHLTLPMQSGHSLFFSKDFSKSKLFRDWDNSYKQISLNRETLPFSSDVVGTFICMEELCDLFAD